MIICYNYEQSFKMSTQNISGLKNMPKRNVSKCCTCLSIDRTLKPLKETNILLTLCPELCRGNSINDCLLLCWECLAMVQKIKIFKNKVMRAQSLLKQTQINCDATPGLSSLKTKGISILSIIPQPNNCHIIQASIEGADRLTQPALPTSPTSPASPTQPQSPTLPTIKQEMVIDEDYDNMIPPIKIKQFSGLDPLEDMKPQDVNNDTKTELTKLTQPNENCGTPNMLIQADSKDPILQLNHDTNSATPYKLLSESTQPATLQPLLRDKLLQAATIPTLLHKRHLTVNIDSENTLQAVTMAPSDFKQVTKKPTMLQDTLRRAPKPPATGIPVIVPHDVKRLKHAARTQTLSGTSKDNSSQLSDGESTDTASDNEIEVTDCGNPDKDVPENKIVRHYEEKEMTCVVLNEKQMLEYREGKRTHYLFKCRPYKCLLCIKKFHSQENLDKHNERHDVKAGPFECNVCTQRFETSAERDSHRKDHYLLYQCTQCPWRSSNVHFLFYHIRKKHKVSQFNCRKCHVLLTSYQALREHQRRVHPAARVKCADCGKLFLKTTLYKHMLGHSKDFVECTVCKKQIIKLKLKIHMRSHSDQDNTVYCAECDTVFKNKTSYETHVKTTLKHNPVEKLGFKCEECSACFATKTTLREHTEATHSKSFTGVCYICKKEFHTARRLGKHVRRHQKQKILRRYVCEICGNTFKSRKSLEYHVNAHMGRRPFKCQDCGNTFCYQAALYTHRRLVHKVKKITQNR